MKIRNHKPEAIKLLYLMLIIFCAVCSNESSIRSKKSTGDIPDQILIDTRIILSEGGKTAAIIESKTVKIYEDSSYSSLEDSVVIYFYDEDGKHTTTLTALSGEVWGLYENADSLKASGNVLIESTESEAAMEAPAILWIASLNKVFGKGLVRLTTENGFEQGPGFEAKDDLSEFEFKGPVTGEVREEGIKLIDR